MTSNDNDRHDSAEPDRLDPVNRWATEHYGFEVDRGGASTDLSTARSEGPVPVPPRPRPPGSVGGRPRRRAALIVSGVLGLAMIAGVGGVAVAAADAGDSGTPGGDPGGGRGAVVQLDGGDGARTGGPGGGRR
jgi:hypothetical protein